MNTCWPKWFDKAISGQTWLKVCKDTTQLRRRLKNAGSGWCCHLGADVCTTAPKVVLSWSLQLIENCCFVKTKQNKTKRTCSNKNLWNESTNKKRIQNISETSGFLRHSHSIASNHLDPTHVPWRFQHEKVKKKRTPQMNEWMNEWMNECFHHWPTDSGFFVSKTEQLVPFSRLNEGIGSSNIPNPCWKIGIRNKLHEFMKCTCWVTKSYSKQKIHAGCSGNSATDYAVSRALLITGAGVAEASRETAPLLPGSFSPTSQTPGRACSHPHTYFTFGAESTNPRCWLSTTVIAYKKELSTFCHGAVCTQTTTIVWMTLQNGSACTTRAALFGEWVSLFWTSVFVSIFISPFSVSVSVSLSVSHTEEHRIESTHCLVRSWYLKSLVEPPEEDGNDRLSSGLEF